MRRLMIIGAAAAMLITGPAMAQPYGDRGYDRGYEHGGDRGDYRGDHRDDREWDHRDDRGWRDGRSGYGGGNAWGRHVRRCLSAYRSYNPRTDRYVIRRGVTARCRL